MTRADDPQIVTVIVGEKPVPVMVTVVEDVDDAFLGVTVPSVGFLKY
jgi:hypothetical protein